jgi:hypothetical protein
MIAVAGCSSSTSSSKPAYCAHRTSLENSVKGLKNVNIGNETSGLKAQVSKIESDATAVVNSAKSDFPSQTSAITSSVDTLKNSVAALPSSPSAAQIAGVTTDTASVVSSVNSFKEATNSKCS